jgi:hypothetical protein
VKENKATFMGLIKSVAVKSLVSGDKSMRITIDVDNPDQATIAAVNQVHLADKAIAVALAELKDGIG